MEQQITSAYNQGMQMPPPIDFAELCKDLRIKGMYTQQEMADLLEVNIRTYQRWEEGKREPNAQAVVRLLAIRDYIHKRLKKEAGGQ